VYATCLYDGEKTRWNRHDFIGILGETHLPEWAIEKRIELQEQSADDAPSMSGMEMR
jgi:hypothetical protein